MIWYWIGVLSLFSWVELGFVILFVVIYLIGELGNIVIWKSNKGE